MGQVINVILPQLLLKGRYTTIFLHRFNDKMGRENLNLTGGKLKVHECYMKTHIALGLREGRSANLCSPVKLKHAKRPMAQGLKDSS